MGNIYRLRLREISIALGDTHPPDRDVRPAASWIKTESRYFNFRYRSAQHFIEVFRNYYGPMLKAFSALDTLQQNHLEKDLYDLISRMNRADDETMIVPSEYLEVVIMKR